MLSVFYFLAAIGLFCNTLHIPVVRSLLDSLRGVWYLQVNAGSEQLGRDTTAALPSPFERRPTVEKTHIVLCTEIYCSHL